MGPTSGQILLENLNGESAQVVLSTTVELLAVRGYGDATFATHPYVLQWLDLLSAEGPSTWFCSYYDDLSEVSSKYTHRFVYTVDAGTEWESKPTVEVFRGQDNGEVLHIKIHESPRDLSADPDRYLKITLYEETPSLVLEATTSMLEHATTDATGTMGSKDSIGRRREDTLRLRIRFADTNVTFPPISSLF